MKDKKKVAELIAALKNEAETEFELHRISVLEKDLIECVPKVEVIDETHQKFNGITFCKNGKEGYYKAYLHRAVYEFKNGITIPKNYHIHHKNANRENNNIDNLEMLTQVEHRIVHNEELKNNLQKYICEECGKEFYGIKNSKRRFCSKRCSSIWGHKHYKKEKKCAFCGEIFSTYISSSQNFCSNSCRAKAISGENVKKAKQCQLDNKKIFVCENCGKEYKAIGVGINRFCSSKCNDQFRYKEARNQEIRKCVVCGKDFSVYKKNKNTKCCSNSCAAKMRWFKRKQNQN